MTNEQIFLKFSADKLRQLGGRVQVCLAKLSQEQIWARGSDNENTVGNLVLHMCGNMRQWIGSGIAGLPDERRRDEEFAARGGWDAASLAAKLEREVAEAAGQIEAAPAERLGETVTVQKYTVTKLEAIYHVVEHFSGHAGQIFFATKLLTGEDLGFYAHLKKAKPEGQP